MWHNCIMKVYKRNKRGRFDISYTGCSVENCNGKHFAKKFCRIHYNRFKKHGNPNIKYKRGRKAGFTGLNKGENNPRWNGGSSEYKNHYEMKKLRKTILSHHPNCIRCNEKAVQIHHLDKDKSNHAPKNLVPVCRNCHRGHYHKRTTGKIIKINRLNCI